MIAGATNSAIVNKFLNYIKSISRREYKSSLRLMLYWGKELVFVKLSAEPVEQKSGRYSDGILDYIFDKSINNVIWKFKLW